MLRTESGRVSKTQLLHLVSAALQSFNVAFFVALGSTPETALVISVLLGALQSVIGVFLRLETEEPMR